MEENQNEDQFLDKYTKDSVEKGITELLEEKELKIKWRREIAENPSIQTFFENYHPNSVQSFIDGYINKKYFAYSFGDMYGRMAEEKRTRWINKAHEHLGFILQKKLFDLQCLWRADQIKLEGIEICFDFELCGQNIFNCPFLEPLNKVDIEHYQAYLLKSDEYYEFDTYTSQDYNTIKEEYSDSGDEGGSIPEWYEYHNLVTGNSSLLLLPNLRGEKELFYRTFKTKRSNEETPPTPAAPTVVDNRPMLNFYDDKDADFFIRTFEDKESQIKFDGYRDGYRSETRADLDYEILIHEMLDEEDNIPIESHYSFREAIKKAHVKFRNRKIAEHLPLAHEQYLFNKQMGFEIEGDEDTEIDIRNIYIKQILHGREGNGEPRDLNF